MWLSNFKTFQIVMILILRIILRKLQNSKKNSKKKNVSEYRPWASNLWHFGTLSFFSRGFVNLPEISVHCSWMFLLKSSVYDTAHLL